MSITSSNNSSENNLTPDELANQSAACCAAVNDHLIGNLNHNNQHSNLYPLYENSNFTGANSYSPTENGLVVKKNSNSNFTTILEVPRSQSATNPVISSSVSSHVQHCANTISNGLSNNLPNGLTIGLSNGLSNGATNQLPNGLQRYTINNQLNKIERYEANVYAKNGQAKLDNDHYANLLPPQYMLDKQSQFNSPNGQPSNSPMNSGPINRNSPVNQSSPFHHVAIANNIYALQQSKIDQSSNSSNNNICTLESQSSNGSRSCLTTPDSKSNERLSVLSKSQPDLSNLETELNCIDAKTGNLNMLPNGQLSSVVNCNQIVGPLCTSQLEPNETELLRVENIYLRKKLEDCVQKVAKLQKFETEIQKVHQIEHMYEELMLSAEKKEKLERAARYKLEIEIKRLHQQNKQLKDQLTSALATKEEQESDLKKEDVQKTDLLFSTLLAQNKELLDLKERQEMELQAQRLTLEEQRKHIEILDSALMSTQNNVIVLESNLRKKMAYEERANNLQKALSNLQLSSERRLQMEKRARACLEKEMEMLKSQNKQADSGSTGANSNEHELERSKKLNREYEEKLLFLEAEVSKWEEKYVEENTMRQLEANAASLPKTNYDNTKAKIAALEKTYQQTALQIVEAKNERLRHMDELHEASKKTTELQATIKDLESKLAEKEAMIKVLNQHSLNRDSVLQQSILAQQRSNLNKHTRSVSSMGLVNSASAANAQASNSSSLIARKLKNLSIAECPSSCGGGSSLSHQVNRYTDLASSNSAASSRTSGYSTTSSTGSVVNENAIKSGTSGAVDDESLKEFDKRLANKSSIIRTLRR